MTSVVSQKWLSENELSMSHDAMTLMRRLSKQKIATGKRTGNECATPLSATPAGDPVPLGHPCTPQNPFRRFPNCCRPDMRAAIYARVSNDDEGKSDSVPVQLDECREFAAQQGLTVVAEFSDDGISGYARTQSPRATSMSSCFAMSTA